MVYLLPLLLPLVATVHAATIFGASSSSSKNSVELLRRVPAAKTYDEWGAWARNHKLSVEAKYGISKNEKRGTGTNELFNQDMDTSYYGSIAVGTPPVSYNVVLDTGSADLILAGSSCSSLARGCEGIPTLAASSSSSINVSSTPFSTDFVIGHASGRLATDTVRMAGFTIPNQVFGLCDYVSQGLLSNPVSGILGLGFQTNADSEATPFWEALVKSGAWDSPLMTFRLTRHTTGQHLEPGGSFTMGFTNSTLYTGNIEFHNIPSGQKGYWIQQMTSLTVQGKSLSLPSGPGSYAAIDTGTNLIGGPSDVISSIYQQINGSRQGTGDYTGHYLYPCDTKVSVTVAFGGTSWSINNEDIQFTKVQDSESLCLGAFFVLGGGGPVPWVVGDTFLKNVYSVYRYEPPSVGFAKLRNTAARIPFERMVTVMISMVIIVMVLC